LGTRVESRVRILSKCAIDDIFDASGKIRPERSQWRMRRFGDLLHQPSHRISGER
jgi:hypothetical protein